MNEVSGTPRDEYFRRVERQFGLRRGGPMMLSPKDWELVRAWHERGVPLKIVLRGINDAFDRYALAAPQARQINSVSYCRQHIERAWEDWRESNASGGATRSTDDPVRAHVAAAIEACRRLAESMEADTTALLEAIDGLESLSNRLDDLDPARIDRDAGDIETRLWDSYPEQVLRGIPRFSPWAV